MNFFSFFIKAFVSGLCIGFVTAIPLGPSGVESIKRSLSSGFKEGFKVSVGAVLADCFYILLINLGLSALLNSNKSYEGFFWIISGIILILFNKVSQNSKNANLDKLINNKYSGMLSGFLITFLNPMTPSLWIGLSGTIMSVWRSKGHMFYFISLISMIIGALSWFALLNILASKGIKNFKTGCSRKNKIFNELYYASFGCRLYNFWFI